MRLKIKLLTVIALLLTACGEQAYEQLGNISYQRNTEPCSNGKKNHWLVDLQAKNARDSMYINTFLRGRKMEIHTPQIDTSTDVYKLLAGTCKGDSIVLKLDANTFYTSLNGTVPSNLLADEKITVKLWMRDKLSDIEHITYKKIFEAKMADAYVRENKWNATLDSASEVYLERLKVNKNVRGDFKKVKIKYNITSLNGNPIANSRAGDLFVYDKNDKGIIRGIRYIVDELAVGESARAVVPSAFAYGENGNEKVPGYMPVIIEIEIVEKIE